MKLPFSSCFLSFFLLFFSLRRSLLWTFADLKRNRFSQDSSDARSGPSGASLSLRTALFTLGEGLAFGSRLSPELIYLGRARHTALCDSNPARTRPPIGQGAGARRPNGKGCLGTQSCAASGGVARPRRGHGSRSAFIPANCCHFTKLLGAPATFQEEKEYIQFLAYRFKLSGFFKKTNLWALLSCTIFLPILGTLWPKDMGSPRRLPPPPPPGPTSRVRAARPRTRRLSVQWRRSLTVLMVGFAGFVV